jgi:hypothetical protein
LFSQARTLSALYVRHGRLPCGIHVQADNCCREGKNQMMFRAAIVCILLGALRWATFGFLRTGHSHDKLDQIFGKVCHYIKQHKFDTPNVLVDLLADLTHANAKVVATKLDQCADWNAWGARVGINFEGHAQKGAPHYFRFCRREDLGMPLPDQGHSGAAERREICGDFRVKRPGDVLLVVKHWLADAETVQVLAVASDQQAASLLANLQPHGVVARRLRSGTHSSSKCLLESDTP